MLVVVQLAKLASFVLFLLAGIRAARARGAARPRAIALFIATLVTINAFSGVTQLDNWPFTSNQLAVTRAPADDRVLTWTPIRGVDANGREWTLDPESFSPVYESLMQYWLRVRYVDLPPEERREAARFLVAKANESRARLAAGRRIGFGRWLGPLACPYWWQMPRAPHASPRPYVALRMYEAPYTIGEIARFHRIVRPAHLIAELRP